MENIKKYRNNLFIIIIFLAYIFITSIFTLKDNIGQFKEDFSALRSDKQYKTADRITKITKIRDSFETSFSKNLFRKYDYIDIYGGFQNILQKRVVEDQTDGKRVIKQSNGFLTFVYPDKDMSEWIRKISAVSNYAKQKNIYMLYADPPWRITGNQDLPFYIKDNVNKVDKKLISGLKENNVNVLQLKNKLDGNVNNWFFKTDHHWNVETAFDAYKKIMKNLEKNIDIEVKDEYLKKYTTKTYKNIFLGTYGKRVGKYYGGIDDFSCILPKFDTKFDVIYNKNWDLEESHRVGNFKKVFIYPEYLKTTELDRESSTYYTYTKGIKAEIKIENLNPTNDKKLLVLTDSYGELVFPYLAINFKSTNVIDVRRFKSIKLYSYIDKFNPDAVIFIHTPSCLYDDTLINFQLK